MLYIRSIVAWAVAHPEAALAASAALVALLRALYALVSRVVAPYPRLRAAVEALAALGPDVLRALLQLARAVTGRQLPSLDLDARDAEIASLRAQIARLQGPASRDGERGHARPGAMLAVVVLLWAGLAVELQGCPRLPPVSGCTPTAQRCGPSGHPEVCSASQRWEPAGDVSCAAVGGVCVLEAGVAHCAPAPSDGGDP